MHLLFLSAGVGMGLCLGAVPGLGGITGMAILLPFTYTLQPTEAFAMMMGIVSITSTSDTIPAILFGVPGTVAAQAVVLDGYAMAKKGEAGRALGASFASSMIGGVVGAVVLALIIPVVRPIVLAFGSPEFFMLGLLGISLVAVISGNAPVKGIIAATLGLITGMIGMDPQLGIFRWGFDTLYLSDGVGLIPLALGLYAVPELIEARLRGKTIAQGPIQPLTGVSQGIRDAFKHFFLTARCSAMGVCIGMIPGLGSAVCDWVAYGHALSSEKGARETFGKGDVRGVIAPESANNAIHGGTLVPTLTFGIPGSANMALVLGAMAIQGLVPGAQMLSTHLDVTYSIVWSVALAHLLGGGICLLITPQLASVSRVRIQLLIPLIISAVFIAAFQNTRQFGDIWVLIVFSIIGWGMKHYGWPRPPILLGFVMSQILEQNLFTSVDRYGFGWFDRPIVIALGCGVLASFFFGIKTHLARLRENGAPLHLNWALPRLSYRAAFTATILIAMIFAVLTALSWPAQSQLFPFVALMPAIVLCGLQLAMDVFKPEPAAGTSGGHKHGAMDLGTDPSIQGGLVSGLTNFILWILGLVTGIYLFGFIIALPGFIFAYLKLQARESTRIAIVCSIAFLAYLVIIFHLAVHIRWFDPVLHAPQERIISAIDTVFGKLAR